MQSLGRKFMHGSWVIVLLGACLFASSCSQGDDPQAVLPPLPRPKNVIVMISDGAGHAQFESTSAFTHGRLNGQSCYAFPVRLALETSTYGVSYDPDFAWTSFLYALTNLPSSNASATALSSGQLTSGSYIGLAADGSPVEHAFQVASRNGKATGLVTSVQISHATPAGFVAHNVSRHDLAGIANEMLSSSSLDVLMGCGHPAFDGEGRSVPSPPESAYQYVGGLSTWNELKAGTCGNDADDDGLPDPWQLVQNRTSVLELALSTAPPKRVLALAPNLETLQQKRGGDAMAAPFTVPFLPDMPSLPELSLAALNVLAQNPNGFVLMIEGGAIDWACHSNQLGRTIEEQQAFDESVDAVLTWVATHSDWNETLLLITADHETGYLTGPGSGSTADGPIWNPILPEGAGVPPSVEWHTSGHTNRLVPFFAKGLASDLFPGLAHGTDPVRGPYLANWQVGSLLKQLLAE